jgi:hypothetical protein
MPQLSAPYFELPDMIDPKPPVSEYHDNRAVLAEASFDAYRGVTRPGLRRRTLRYVEVERAEGQRREARKAPRSQDYSTVTDLARFLGWSTSVPSRFAMW